MKLLERDAHTISYKPCPDCGSETELSVFPSPTAGIWQCLNPDCAVSDEHEHGDTITQTAVSWPVDQYDEPQEEEVQVCAVCGLPLDHDDYEPDYSEVV